MRGIVLDLDGTLLNAAKQVSERNANALLACRQEGMKVIYATGRPPRSVRHLLPPELRSDASFVYYNGALVVDADAGIDVHTPIEPETAAEILDYCAERLPQEIRISLESQDRLYASREIRDPAFFSKSNRPTICAPKAMKQYVATKILLSEFGGAEGQLREAFAAKTRFIATDGGKLIQIMHPSVSKVSGVLIVCAHYGIATSELIAFGDDHNDLELFTMSAHAVAMGNAVNELKALATEVTDTNDRDGVAIVLERLLG
ncbi:HAD family hydrolase [Paenibacillus glycinis]|uniref:Cof-type HAD-IIB family hydrolase n=1 Tax=Paenibacillus glycinis TaxID=2697035 RepID=A0ABW9XNG2_9BACL|nr:HAD family hydrolase [Paenibacillus glycinis]NBD24166.1 Cof-type HAD-IIB family hydrolase [Paenibacillus glycinis]